MWPNVDPSSLSAARISLKGNQRSAAEMTLHDMVAQAASLHSGRKAVWFDGCNDEPPTFYTYATVIKHATELTAFLQKYCDPQGRCEIGLYCCPGINLPSWILGILQVPAAYCPIDPDAPPLLSTHFMRKSNLQYILVENDKIKQFQTSHAGWLSCSSSTIEHIGLTLFQVSRSSTDVNLKADNVKSKLEAFKVMGNSQLGNAVCSEHLELKASEEGYKDVGQRCSLAYVLHTSGTTGTPKIVRVPHTCIVLNIQHLKSIFEITQDDVLFLASPLTFDPSVVELFIALTSGASILIVPNAVKMMPVELSTALFNHHHVTVLQATPTLFRRFGAHIIKSTVLSADTSLRVLALGGEAFPVLNLWKSWKHKDNKTSIFNLYGITEVSSWATCYRIPEEVFSADFRTDFPVPLGSPLLGTLVEIRDANGSAVLEGEGQIFIGGAERICFLDDEIMVPQDTMRETGDFVRVQNAEIFFLGRKDNQIKRHGKRFNIECLQQAAEDLCQVEACAVTWYQQEKLILFVVPRGDLQERETLCELQKRLPTHGIPDELVQIRTLPLTSHGKVDISELNKIYHYHLNSRRRDSKLSGAEELWERLQYLWKSVLGLLDDSSGISKDAVFLYSGGDSFKALQFYDEIEMLVGRGVPGLLEVILSRPIEEVYKHILKTLFPDEDQLTNDDNVLKRKLSKNNGEEIHGKYAKLKSEGYLRAAPGLISFVALSRGNHFLTMHFTKSVMEQYSTEKVGGDAESSHLTTAELALRTRWKSDTRKCVDASPLIVISSKEEETASVFVGSHSHTMQSIDLETGEVKWEKNLGDRIESSACVSKCGHFIVVGCYDGLVYVLQSSDGETYWTFATEDTVKSSAVVDPSSGLVYVGSHDQHMYALDIYEKLCVWKLHCEGGAVFSSPCLSSFPHHVYVATLGGLLLAVDPVTGDKIWKSFLGKPLFSSPHCNEKCVCIGCVDGNLYCYNHSGEKVWQFSTNGPVFSSPCISSLTKQEVFFGSHDHFIYCCNMEGNLLWKFKATSSVYGTPFVFQSDDSKNKVLLAAVSTDGKVWILNARTGTAEGIDTLPGEVFSSPVVWGTKLVVGCRNDYVYCLDLYITGKKE
ncbi:beta-alanine-activating enzyme isoform X1 [Coturnix japonica]|nr:beta-alanine-activating enzyme isoform X1 [Coturnix japonica]